MTFAICIAFSDCMSITFSNLKCRAHKFPQNRFTSVMNRSRSSEGMGLAQMLTNLQLAWTNSALFSAITCRSTII